MWLILKTKPKLTEPRKLLAHQLVKLARKIYPSSEAVYAFHASLMYDQLVTGQSIVRINPMDVYEEEKDVD